MIQNNTVQRKYVIVVELRYKGLVYEIGANVIKVLISIH